MPTSQALATVSELPVPVVWLQWRPGIWRCWHWLSYLKTHSPEPAEGREGKRGREEERERGRERGRGRVYGYRSREIGLSAPSHSLTHLDPHYTSSSLSHLPNILRTLLQLFELGHGVMSQRLVQWTIAKLISEVRVSSLLHQQSHYLYVPALHSKVEGGLEVDVLGVWVSPLGGRGEIAQCQLTLTMSIHRA